MSGLEGLACFVASVQREVFQLTLRGEVISRAGNMTCSFAHWLLQDLGLVFAVEGSRPQE